MDLAAGGDHPPRVVALPARVDKADLRPCAEGNCPLLVEIATIEPPQLAAVSLNEKVKAFSVGQLVVALPRFGVGDGRSEKLSHDGIVPVHQGPPIPSRIPTLFPIGAVSARI